MPVKRLPASSLDEPLAVVGMPGAGKTTVAAAIATVEGVPHFDLDAVIEDLEGVDVPTIFASKGEAYFRQLECRALELISRMAKPHVLSLGGGALEREDNRSLIRESYRTLWLRASLEVLKERLEPVKDSRPLLRGRGELMGVLYELALKRDPLYQELADLEVWTGNRSVFDVVYEVLWLLRESREPLT